MNMAIDLATSFSPFEFQNGDSPLDVLAAVASETLRNEIHRIDTHFKTSSNLKRQIKKSAASVMTFEDIKSMPVKSLVDKFSEMTSDELTKKYFYKCLLLPQKCSMTFKSFGNEKKACDEIKSHLMSHVQKLIEEYESNNGISNAFFIPKSPSSNSKHVEKIPKKSFKKQVSLSHILPRANSVKVSKKPKNSTYCVRKVKKKFNNMKRKHVTQLKKCFNKDKGKMFNSVYLKENPNINHLNDNCTSELDDNLPNGIKVKNEQDRKYERESYNSYSEHLEYASLSDAVVKEEVCESACNSEQISDSNDSNSILGEMNCSSGSNAASLEKCFPFLQDHNYAIFGNTEDDKILPQDSKSSPRKYMDPWLQRPIEPKLALWTPAFPYVHIPLFPENVAIEQTCTEGYNSGLNEYTNCIGCIMDEKKVKSEVEEMQIDDHTSDNEGKFATTVFYKINGPSSSVLECVENIVNVKHSNSCVPKGEISSNENDENLENVQKGEKELALKYIANLHAKGKKKISDSLMCKICPDKQFTAQATLIHHYRSHAGIKPYICKICSSKFTRQHSLNYHMLIHQNLSRFTCEFCGRTFRHPSHYKEHLRRHTGESPYHCTDCDNHFKTRNTFKRHLKTRHGKLLTASGIEDLATE